ncbi:methylitaconate delta2-delta3-isomerase [Micrococcales bacterium 31B]|nr:methylitaconate delta2-delta3-isomerase [Micrococcales bacterium 31B]
MHITAEWMRGGTSKCWVFDADHLRRHGTSLDTLLPRVFGSPDHRQIDGVGGATSTTSKAMIVNRSVDPAVDVEFTFAQVGIEEATVDWGSNCGNCSAAVGLYAVQNAWVQPTGDLTDVRTRNTNTGQLILQRIPTPGGALPENPTATMDGVPFPGHEVQLGFSNPAGRTTGRLLPTGTATEMLSAQGTPLTVSMVDAGAPLVIVRAEDLGLTASTYATWSDTVQSHLDLLDRVRRLGAVRMGLAENISDAARAVPKLAIVGAPDPADTDADLCVLMLSMGKPHPALAVTGSVGLTLAARTPGTVAHAALAQAPGRTLRLRTPVGVLETWTDRVGDDLFVGTTRTARSIASATIHLPDFASQSDTFDSTAAAELVGATA